MLLNKLLQLLILCMKERSWGFPLETATLKASHPFLFHHRNPKSITPTKHYKHKHTSSRDHLILHKVFFEFFGSLLSGSVEWRSSSSSSLQPWNTNIAQKRNNLTNINLLRNLYTQTVWCKPLNRRAWSLICKYKMQTV